MTSSNSSLSPLGDLGKLPAELRNEIYTLALTTDQPIELSHARLKNPKYDEAENEKLLKIQQQPKCIFHLRSKVRMGSGKRTRKVAAAHALAFPLLSTSKAVRAEAQPILYGRNTFNVKGVGVISTFAEKAGAGFDLITRVSCDHDAMEYCTEEWQKLSRLPGFKHFDICVGPCQYVRNPRRSAIDEACQVWSYIKYLVAFEEVRMDDDSIPHHLRRQTCDLPEELQLLRLRGFRFQMDKIVNFSQFVDSPEEFIDDAEERNARFRTLVEDELRADIEAVQNATERKQAVIDEMLREARSKQR